MTYTVIIEKRAAEDIAAYGRWIVDQGAPLNAARWIDGIEDAITSLETMPERCGIAPEAEGFGHEVRQLIFKSHRVLFVVEGDSVHVLHVRHGSRRPLAPDYDE